jgi:hypothetical protein
MLLRTTIATLQAQAIAQVDAEVFRQKEAMQEVKAGYLKVL